MCITKKAHFNELMDYVQARLVPRQHQKKQNGEVFTPLELINGIVPNMNGGSGLEVNNKRTPGMLDHLPKRVWSDPLLKWLDPANGIGNFPICVYYRLMKGLAKCPGLENEEKRKRHIINKMLYMVELDPVNADVSRSVFCGKGVKPNINQGDFLEADLRKEFGVDKFDVIMGNPPYQKKVGPRKTQAIWNLFVKKSLNLLLKKGGYLLFIHPSGWRGPTGNFRDIFELINSRNLEYLSINNYDTGKKMFGVGTNFDYYLLQNTKTDSNITNVKDIDNNNINIDLNDWRFIPSGDFDIFRKILSSGSDDIVDIIYSSSIYEIRNDYMSKKKSTKFKYPCVYTITSKKGVNLWYSREDKGMFGIPKVIWSNGAGTYPIIDATGKYGLTQFSYAIADTPENLKKIKQALDSEKFTKLMTYVKFNQDHKYSYKVIALFKKDFWKYFIPSKTQSKEQTAGSSPLYLKPYLQNNHHYLLNFYHKIKQNKYTKTNNNEKQSILGLIDLFQQKAGHKLRESNVNEIIRNLDQPRYLKQLFYHGFDNQVGGHSRRIRPLYLHYHNKKF